MQDQIQAYQSAKKELDEESKRKLVDEMKGLIRDTLQKIEDTKGEIADKQQELKALKADLSDLENGRLDKIKERQDKDPVSRRVTTVVIERIIERYPYVVPYFQPYYVPVQPLPQITYTSGTFNQGTLVSQTTGTLYGSSDVSGTYTIQSSGGNTKAFYIG